MWIFLNGEATLALIGIILFLVFFKTIFYLAVACAILVVGCVLAFYVCVGLFYLIAFLVPHLWRFTKWFYNLVMDA
jgi:hypothetical protein